MKTTSVSSLALAAAFAGLLGGATARLNAELGSANAGASATTASATPGILLAGQDQPAPPKHSCKGKNDCKGQGGGKNPGQNSCKGKGDCATDGSKPRTI